MIIKYIWKKQNINKTKAMIPSGIPKIISNTLDYSSLSSVLLSKNI